MKVGSSLQISLIAFCGTPQLFQKAVHFALPIWQLTAKSFTSSVGSTNHLVFPMKMLILVVEFVTLAVEAYILINQLFIIRLGAILLERYGSGSSISNVKVISPTLVLLIILNFIVYSSSFLFVLSIGLGFFVLKCLLDIPIIGDDNCKLCYSSSSPLH